MITNHRIKHNGIVYPAGTDVPVGNDNKPETIEKVVEEQAEIKPTKPKTTAKKAKK